MSDGLLNEAAEKALAKLERSHAYHDEKNRRIRKQQDAYEGILNPLSEAAQWESQLHPPILNHTIETALTMLVDNDTQFKIDPLPRNYKPGEYQDAIDGAKAHEDLFKRQMIADRYNEFLRPFVLTAAINRVAIAKTHWREDKRVVKTVVSKKLAPMFGPLSPTRLRETTAKKTFFDGPVTEVVDLRDFYWDQAAVSLDVSRWCAHAIWMSEADIRALAQQGTYDSKAADLLSQDQADRQASPSANEIELEREKRGRKDGLIEVLEVWDRDTMTLHVIGARRVLLFQGDWPFWHQEYPFVSMSLAPFPFSIQGLSLVEKLSDMQSAYWSLLNQTVDNTKLLNNAIILMAADYDDPDSFEYAPGAVNIVDNPQQVNLWTPPTNIAQIAMPLMQTLQTDMSNLAMGQPLSIPLSGRVTATEIATLSQIAQTAASKMKDQITYAEQRIGQQRMWLNQQFVRETTYFSKLGLDRQPVIEEVAPHKFQGDYQFSIKPDTESNIRAEERSEAQAMVTVMAQIAPATAAMGVPLNPKPFVDRWLKSFGVDDPTEFYSAKPQMPPGGAGSDPNAPQGPPQGIGPGGERAGVTGPGSIDPAVSPSGQGSLAPGVMMARAMASQGGGQNEGRH